MLPHPDMLKAVLLGGDGVIHAAPHPAIVVDMSTSGPLAVRDCATRLAEAGIGMVDALVGKGPWAAEKGELSILLGGEDNLCQRVEPLLRHIGNTIYRCGPLGSGQAVKLANNLASCANIAVAVEAWTLAARTGADVNVLKEVMPQTSADSWQLRHTLIGKVLCGDFAPMFKLSLAHKDLRLIADLADTLNVPINTTRGAIDWYEKAMAAGHGDLDWGAIALVEDPNLFVTAVQALPSGQASSGSTLCE